MKTEEVNYQLDEHSYNAFVAYPEDQNRPLVLIAHTWAGRDGFVEERARQLAEEGYVAMAVDMYGDCLLYTSPSPRDYAASRMPSSA